MLPKKDCELFALRSLEFLIRQQDDLDNCRMSVVLYQPEGALTLVGTLSGRCTDKISYTQLVMTMITIGDRNDQERLLQSP